MKKKFLLGSIIILLLIGIFLIYKFYYIKINNSDNNSTEESMEKISIEESLELFGDYYLKANKIVDDMSIDEKIGQLFLVRYDSNLATSQIGTYYPGGYILFAKDLENHTKESILEELSGHQKESKYPLIFGVDEEGGYVTRVSRFTNFRSERFKSVQQVYAEGGYELLEQTEKEKAQLLLSLGFNLNLAPVADVSTNSNDFIYNRSFGKNAEETAKFIENMVIYANEMGISSCLKHFPGYGNNIDTHNGSAYDKRSYENFMTNDFLPFKSGIDALVPTILVSHNVVESIDSNYPASLSSKVIAELRNTLGFSGVVITDDLAMGAVDSYVEVGNAATLAINAGNDMIITSDFEVMYQEVLNAYNNKEIKEETINKAVRRVIAWKYAYGLI